MQTDQLLSDEELDVLVRKVWDERQSNIKDDIDAAIRYEFSQRFGASIKRIIAKEVYEAIRPHLDLVRPALEAKAKEVAEGLIHKLEGALVANMHAAVSEFVATGASQIFQAVGWSIKSHLLEALKVPDQKG